MLHKEHPHFYYGCDWCDGEADEVRIRGPVRYHREPDADCCPRCYHEKVPTADRDKFVQLGLSSVVAGCLNERAAAAVDHESAANGVHVVKLNPLESDGADMMLTTPRDTTLTADSADLARVASLQATPVTPTTIYSLWLMPRPGELQQRADHITARLSAHHGVNRCACHVPLVPGYFKCEVACTAADAAAAAFRTSDGSPLLLTLGSLKHAPSRQHCVTALVQQHKPFEDARNIAERIKREKDGGQHIAVWDMPHVALLHAELSEEARREMVAMAGGPEALDGVEFQPNTVAVWNVSTHDPSKWMKLYEARV